ncbi:MAG TPA: hypothetical protein PKX91_05050 [Clostridia bacterium]|nr:hypothetical protein [Clostridia bacterium]
MLGKTKLKQKVLVAVIIIVLVALVAGIMVSCSPPSDVQASPFFINDSIENEVNKDKTQKDEAVDRATGSLDNLLQYLDSEIVSTTGYYVGAKMHVNTEDGSAFILNLQANMYTWPYEQYAEGTPEREEALAKHNELIKYNDLVLEWYDGTTNTMLIGFYFDGINPDPADPGNILYLNLQGSKRYFLNFGDTVLYQQLIRLITQFSLENVIASTSSDDSSDTAISSVNALLKQAVTTNYKLTLNGDVTSVYFNDIPLTIIAPNVTNFIQGIFGPFDDKLDPLTFKYLGFLFSVLGTAEIRTLNSYMQFLMKPNEALGKEILTGMDVEFRGSSLVRKKNREGDYNSENVPFTVKIAVDYDIRVSQNIVLDRENYKLFENGNFEFIGDMYIPQLDLKLDTLIRTDMNRFDNKTNKVYMSARDLATDDLIIGLFYKDELTYIDIEGLQHLYGGIKFEDIGLPKAYKGGFNLASTLEWFSEFIDAMIVLLVDNILTPKENDASSKYNEVMTAIMDNIESTMKDEDDPTSHATIKVKIDMPLIKRVLSVTSKTNTNFTTDQIIQLLNRQFNIDLEAIASILGMSVEELLDRTYFEITYDVDTHAIKIEVYSAAEKPRGAPADLYLRLDLIPIKFGEKVRIAFPNFDNFKELQDVMTYSGYIEGQFLFAQTEEVDLSRALGAFMGDTSGLNTPFILPKAADIYFTMLYDQYIREQVLENGRWTRKGRSAFDIRAYMMEGSDKTEVLRIYANDVSFNTAHPLEELGYVWLDYKVFDHLPKFKIREDLFVTSLYEYMGYDFENESGDIVLGLTDIVKALMEDSWATFEPDVIRVTTSNDTIKQFFGVDEMIGSLAIQIGFKQRVKNIDQLEKDFAMYSVGEFTNITGASPYSTKLHETIPVYFDFGTRIETRNLKFLYNQDSIEIIAGNAYYRPRIDKQFMGVTRDYLVYISSSTGRQKIAQLVEDYYVWEPLGVIPTSVRAYYGEMNMVNTYAADYNLHAVFNKNNEYYTVVSENGYEILYDSDNKVYIVGLGSEYKLDKAYEELGPDVTVYPKEFTFGPKSLRHLYDLGLRLPGYYVVQNDAGMNILYNYKTMHYIVSSEDYARMETIMIDDAPVERRVVEGLLGNSAVIRLYDAKYAGKNMTYDIVTGWYMASAVGSNGTVYEVHYNPTASEYIIPPALESQLPAIAAALGTARIVVNSSLDLAEYPYTRIDRTGGLIDAVDWDGSIYDGIEYNQMTWEDLTLEGGKFVVKVVIGEGMMATYVEPVVVKVLNRTVLTDLPYININTPNGQVKAPIAMTVDVDPIAYLLYKAYYINGLRNNEAGFVRWFFDKYDVRIQFTKVYPLNPEEETPDEVGAFVWAFDFINENTIYTEKQINNYGDVTDHNYTYVYTNFHGQIIALRLRVLPREFKYFTLPGEAKNNTHTVDVLYPSTYYIPTNLTYYFEGLGGQMYTLNFGNLLGSTIFADKPTRMPNIGSVLKGPNAKPLVAWAHEKVDNVKLVNERDENNNPKPFTTAVDNKTTAFLNFSGHFDENKEWFYEDWFKVPYLIMNVDVPDKVVETFNKELKTENHTLAEYALRNIKIKDYINAGEEYDIDDELLGIFNVDPFDKSTWVLPTEIAVFFTINKDAGIYQRYDYNNEYDSEGTLTKYGVEWKNIEGDTAVHFTVDSDGKYTIADVSENPGAYYLETTIGDATTDNHIVLRLLVRNLSVVASDVEFYNADGSTLKNAASEELTIISEARILGVNDGNLGDSLQEKVFTYKVDTYKRFDIPKLLRVTFKDGSVREYFVDDSEREYFAKWSENTPWKENTLHTEVYVTLGASPAFSQKIYLTYDVDRNDLVSLNIVNCDAGVCTINIDEETRTITVDGIKVYSSAADSNDVSNNGFVVDADGEFVLVNNKKVNVYDYFMYLFSEIEGSFLVGGSNPETIAIHDAATSAELPLYGTIDLQKMITILGQGVDIYVGQGKGADDFTVTVKVIDATPANQLVIDEDRDSYIIKIDGSELGLTLQAYNPDNTPKYPNGYVISENFGFKVKYVDGREVYYANSVTADAPVPRWWSVVKSPVPGLDPEETWMLGLKEFDKIDRLSEISIYGGGAIWLSTLLPDGSRVYARFASVGISIGSDYSSEEGVGRYYIENGVITINNIYDHYTLGTNIIPSRLPSRILLAGSLVISGVEWTMEVTPAELDAINYLGTAEDIVIARARVMRETVYLKLRVLPCEVLGVSYIYEDENNSRSLISQLKNDDGDIIINFDAYKNSAYAGSIGLSRVLNLHYGGSRVFVYQNIEYFPVNPDTGHVATVRQTSAPYDLNGHTLSINGLDLDKRNIRFKVTLIDGQVVNLILHFNDKTVKKYSFANIGDSDNDKNITLNPYSEYVDIPSNVTIEFLEGPPLVNYPAVWTRPPDYEVRYDTNKTILIHKPDNQKYFLLTSEIVSNAEEFAGYPHQNLVLKVNILDYILERWSLEAGVDDFYVTSGDTHYENPNAKYHMRDPYAGKATDLPSSVEDIRYYPGNDEHRLPVVWDFTDADIIAAGTPSGHILVKGWIYDRDRGQPITIKLYIDTWDFDTIRRLQGGTYQSMMHDIRFYFSQISNKSSYQTYEVAFKVKNVRDGSDPVSKSVIFIPEDIDPTTVKIAGTDNYYPADHPYRIKWDEGALIRARNAMSTGGDAVGNFSLANGNAAIVRTTPAYNAYYQFETLTITQVDLGYGYGSTNEAIYVVDPLNPYFGTNYVLPIKAKGNYNLESNIDLNSKGMVVSAVWWQPGTPAISIPDKYVGGGVYKGWAVTIRVENPNTGFIYQGAFRIMMVFLDMSPITYINNQSMNVLNRGAIKTNYNTTTYVNAINPYENSYTTSLMKERTLVRDGVNVTGNVLNIAIKDYNLEGKTLDYTVTEWDPNILINNNMHIQYSRKVTIRGRSYTTSIVRRQYNAKFEITGLDLGYGMGIDSAKYDMLSSDPMAIAGKEKTMYMVNPLDISFASSGIPMAGDEYKYTFMLPETKVQGNYNGSPFVAGAFKYRVEWWNEQLQGNLYFASDIAVGGYLDHFKVVLRVFEENEEHVDVEVYSQVYNIILFFLDARTGSEMKIISAGSNITMGSPKKVYGANDYAGGENPYGAYYTDSLRTELTNLASVVHADKSYLYEVTKWNEAVVEGGMSRQTAKEIRIYPSNSNPSNPKTIYSATPFITREYAV